MLANVDMLVDYGEDFTDKAMVVENMQTAYQVGKGMLKHVQEMARQAEERENPNDDEPELEEKLPDDEREVLVTAAEDTESPEPVAIEPDFEPEDYTPPAPRRMKFRAEETA